MQEIRISNKISVIKATKKQQRSIKIPIKIAKKLLAELAVKRQAKTSFYLVILKAHLNNSNFICLLKASTDGAS